MPNSLLTGVSGLLAHQRMLDVVGHNIANMNTTAFKSQRILFADLLYETVQPATGSSEGNQGGTNPNQIGGGVKAALTDRNWGQGALESTGGSFDFALNGPGFFTLTTNTGDQYTRAGAFTLDDQGFLVAPGGLHLKRFTSAGEPDGVNPGFQIPGDPRIQIPLGATVEGVATENAKITGNLNSEASPPIAQSLRSILPFTVGGANVSASDLLNSADSVTTPYVAGDKIEIEGTSGEGEQVLATLDVGPTTTFQDLLDGINAAYPNAEASIEQGNIILRSSETGKSALDLSLRNATTNNDADGGIILNAYQFQIDVEGKDAGEGAAIMTVYDGSGGEHELTIKFNKQSDDIWSMTAVMEESEGVILNDTISNIVFDDSGKLLRTGVPTITIQFDGIDTPQTIAFDFGDEFATEKLSHYTSETSLATSADGAAPGVLTGAQVESSGEIKGVASNGKIFTLAQLAITSFDNTKGMIALGDNMYQQSLNSGQPNVGQAGTGGRGSILGGQLEASNVDVGTEFTKLIVAQRGFSANARTITISSEVLEELTNIIR